MEGLNEMEKVKILVDFIIALRNSDCRSKTYIGRVLSALAFTFRTAFKDSSFFENPIVHMAKEASKDRGRSANIHRRNRKKLPATIDMIEWIRDNYCQGRDIDREMTGTACIFAFHFGRRVSEYSLNAHDDSDHSIRAEDVEFVLPDRYGGRIPSYKLTKSQVPKVLAVAIIVRSSKNDIEGRGHQVYLSRESPLENELLNLFSYRPESSPLILSSHDTWRGEGKFSPDL